MKRTKNVPYYYFGHDSLEELKTIKNNLNRSGLFIYFIDNYFKLNKRLWSFSINAQDLVIYVDTETEPNTKKIDEIVLSILNKIDKQPDAIIGIGGGCTLDTAKAVSNLMTNGGKAEDYQGWNLVKTPGIYKIGIPTLSGTGTEVSKTCVLTNYRTGAKLGMNSEFSVFDEIILDPNLSKTVERNQYFYTGMDTYFHCMESLAGSYRNNIIDALSEKAVSICRDVFMSNNMMSPQNREKMMVASYLGGMAAGNTGLVHPFSAGLSVALGLHHGVANCIAMIALEEFYPNEHQDFIKMKNKQNIEIPTKVCYDWSDKKSNSLYNSTIIHEKPLKNSLGENYKDILTKEKVISIFKKM